MNEIHFSKVVYFKNENFYEMAILFKIRNKLYRKMTSEFFDTIKPINRKQTIYQ